MPSAGHPFFFPFFIFKVVASPGLPTFFKNVCPRRPLSSKSSRFATRHFSGGLCECGCVWDWLGVHPTNETSVGLANTWQKRSSPPTSQAHLCVYGMRRPFLKPHGVEMMDCQMCEAVRSCHFTPTEVMWHTLFGTKRQLCTQAF